ncbi:helix-turn-helix domain-containing protein [Streptomyces sp. NPDC056160]|uniref:AraC-like ligand-binding domain-containing protein n=1 Tax=Streptomyces sp. NPDC056160 TaxID=3345731 RepID=UPI0035D74EC8
MSSGFRRRILSLKKIENRGKHVWTVVSSSAVPATERFDWFADMVSREVVPTAISSGCPARFRAEAALLDLGGVAMSRLAYLPLHSRRTPALIRRSDPEQYQLALVTKSSMALSQQGNDGDAAAGDLVLWDTSRPWVAQSPDEGGMGELVVLQLSRSAMPLRERQIERLLARRIPGGLGMAAMLASFMRSLVENGDRCTPEELARLGTITADLAAACLAQHLDVEEDLPVEVRAQALLRRIHTFIDHHLGDPELNPSVVAAHHNMSLRTLHQLFHGTGESVQARIRRRRLERCRAALSRPELRAPIQAIAARWGFSGPAVFSRTFREVYGLSPSEFRALSVKECCAERALQ